MDTELRRTLADTIITINNRYSYHIEAQMEKDEDIVFRVFEYGFHHADHRRASTEEYHVLRFPEPKIIYLYATRPDSFSALKTSQASAKKSQSRELTGIAISHRT